MKKIIKIHSPQAMIAFGEALGRRLPANSIIALEGDLGAGKTTLTKGIGLGLGIQSIINSPTFTIMKIHEGRMKLYHLDVYRLDKVKDDFELEEYFGEGGVCVIEWASRI
jgi:tRNA threonylcarbamoyladenosine biosynthesis protein TsaE